MDSLLSFDGLGILPGMRDVVGLEDNPIGAEVDVVTVVLSLVGGDLIFSSGCRLRNYGSR